MSSGCADEKRSCCAQEIEAGLLKRDEAKAALREQTDKPAAVAKALALNDASIGRRRGKMMLPAPQVQNLAPACGGRRTLHHGSIHPQEQGRYCCHT